MAGLSPLWVCHPWAGGPELHEKAGWTSHREETSKPHVPVVCPCFQIPVLGLTDVSQIYPLLLSQLRLLLLGRNTLTKRNWGEKGLFDFCILGHSPLREAKENDRFDATVLHSDTAATYNNINSQSGFKWDGMKT